MPYKPVLITGVNGFVGHFLSAHLAAHDRKVIGIDIHEKSNIHGIDYFQVNICDIDCIMDIFKKVQPCEIYHLAAVSSPEEFNHKPYGSFQINLMGAISLFEAMRILDVEATMLVIGSAKQYRVPACSGKLSEICPLAPANYYGVSKNAVEMIAHYYIQQYYLDIRLTRSFNHTGPNQSPHFVCSDWAHQIARMELKQAPPQLYIGNINAVIDFSDVRDVVEAYRLVVERGQKGEIYNVCSGRGISLKYILDYLVSKCSIDISISIQKDKVAEHSLPKELIGDNGKIIRETGWLPKISIEQTLDDLYAWWLTELRDQKHSAT